MSNSTAIYVNSHCTLIITIIIIILAIVQRFNSVLIHESVVSADEEPDL